MLRTERSGYRLCHLPVGSSTECGELGDLPSARTIGNASRLAPRLRGKVRDKLQGLALSVAAWREFASKRHLDVFKELSYLRLWKTEHQSSQ